MVRSAAVLLVVSACSGALASASEPRALTVADRDRARDAIERVDGRRAIGAAGMAALEAHWKISLTDDMLENELLRMAREIQPPERLLELYAALGNDPILVKECLARPALVERISRDRFAFDPEIHAGARAEAEELSRRLRTGELDPWVDHPRRSVLERARRASDAVAAVPALEEQRDGFVVSVVLSAMPQVVRVARYVVSKLTFDAWWATAKKPPPGESIATVAVERAALPLPALESELESACAGDPQLVDVGVTSTIAPDPVFPGGVLTHTIVMFNSGPGAAVDAEMLEQPPEGTTYRSITWTATDGGWVCTVPSVGAHGKISCTNKCFAPGGSVTFTVTSGVEPCVGNLQMTSTTEASSASDEYDPRNNTAAAATNVLDDRTCDDGNLCTDGDHCAPGLGYSENFDALEAPALPPGWTATLILGPPGGGTWRTSFQFFDTPFNSAFMPNASDVRDSVLDSPGIPILSPNAQLRFRNRYDLEKDDDGGVLEIKIGDLGFQDILSAGGTFVSGGYNGIISLSFGSPIGGREAWTGASGQFVLTTVNLPASAAGKIIRLRWRVATDQTRSAVGQWIDSVAVSGRDHCGSGAPLTCNDNDACTADSCGATTGCGHVPISCDDGEVCTDDSCAPLLGCVHAGRTAACDDFNACTLADVCASGTCVGLSPAVCQDGDACTADACDPSIGCLATTANFDTTGFSAARVDGRDLAVLAESWNTCPNNLRYNVAANLDPVQPCINANDFHLFMNVFGRDCAP